MNAFSFLRRILFFVLLATVGFVGSVRAQSPNGSRQPFIPEIREIREPFTLRALDAGRMLADQYAKALTSLETQAIEADDYDTALSAQQRRLKIVEYYSNRNLDSSNGIVLKPADGKISGAVALIKSENTLAFLRTSGGSATWDVSKITPGIYTVSIVCGVGDIDPELAGDKPGNEIEFGEVTNLIGADIAKLGLTLESTGGWNEFKVFTLGDIKLSRITTRFAIKASALHGTGGLMRLQEIRLTPALPILNQPDTEVMTATLRELEEIRTAHQEKLKELEQPVLSNYLSKLTALSDERIAKNDEDGARVVIAESKRAHESFEKSGKFTHASTGGPTAEGLEEVLDVAFVEAPSNRGDRFLVTTGGGRFSVRLMSVSCPSPNPEDHSLNDFHDRYFGIKNADSIMIGRQAKDFTTAYLKDRPLKLRTRWHKDDSGSVLADVASAEIGDFGGILVDNGLAAILEPTSKNPSQRKVERSVRDALKQREADARAKPLPPGAWALAVEIKPAP